MVLWQWKFKLAFKFDYEIQNRGKCMAVEIQLAMISVFGFKINWSISLEIDDIMAMKVQTCYDFLVLIMKA